MQCTHSGDNALSLTLKGRAAESMIVQIVLLFVTMKLQDCVTWYRNATMQQHWAVTKENQLKGRLILLSFSDVLGPLLSYCLNWVLFESLLAWQWNGSLWYIISLIGCQIQLLLMQCTSVILNVSLLMRELLSVEIMLVNMLLCDCAYFFSECCVWLLIAFLYSPDFVQRVFFFTALYNAQLLCLASLSTVTAADLLY